MTVYGTLLNFREEYERIEETLHLPPYQKPPEAPVLYIKPANTVSGNGDAIPLPDGVSEVAAGAGLGIVIGKKAARVREEEAYDYIKGYVIVNDVTIPHTSYFRPAMKEKARDGFCPIGPAIPINAVENPGELGIRIYINGELRKTANTSDLIRPIPVLLAELTDFMTLEPGDIVLTGVPDLPPLARDGDLVRIEIDQLGILENKVEAERRSGG